MPKCNERQEIVASHKLRANFWMMAEVSQPLHEKIVDFLPGRDVTDNELRFCEITPTHLFLGKQVVIVRKDDKHPFEP